MEDSLVVQEGILVTFPSVPFAMCLLLRQLLLQGSFHQEEVKQPHCKSLTKLSSHCKCLAITKFGRTVVMCLPAGVVARSSTQTTASTDTIRLCVGSLTTGRVFSTSPCGARTTIEEIILNLNVWGEEERKRILASSRKRADILYPLKLKIYCVGFQ